MVIEYDTECVLVETLKKLNWKGMDKKSILYNELNKKSSDQDHNVLLPILHKFSFIQSCKIYHFHFRRGSKKIVTGIIRARGDQFWFLKMLKSLIS